MSNAVYTQFITSIRYYSGALKALNGMTFIMDNNWEYGASDVPTLPVCFFHLKGIHEVMNTDVSQKTALFYNDDNGTASATSGSVLNIIADNIVTKPKQYKLDMVIPYTGLSMLTSSPYLNAETQEAIFNTLIGKGGQSSNLSAVLSPNTTWWNILLSSMKLLMNSNLSQAASNNLSEVFGQSMTNLTTVPDYNKNSLEAMWQHRALCKLKLWNSWAYKYVAITDLDISKEPLEEGVYEASMTCTEVPIVFFKNNAAIGNTWENKLTGYQGETIKTLLNTLEAKQ